jgi:hypothetical protein
VGVGGDNRRWSVIEDFFDWEPGRVATELGAVPERSVRHEIDELREQVDILEAAVERLLEASRVTEKS